MQQLKEQSSEALQQRNTQSRPVEAVRRGPEVSSSFGCNAPRPSTGHGIQVNEAPHGHTQMANPIEELVAKQNLLMETLMDQQIRSLLRKLEMTTFTGNVTEYANCSVHEGIRQQHWG